MQSAKSVQTFGTKKTAKAVALCKQGVGLIKVNGQPVELLNPVCLVDKIKEVVTVVGKQVFDQVDIRVRTRGGGSSSTIYAIRQAIARAILAYNGKYIDEASKIEIRKRIIDYDRSLIVADPRRCEPKKFGGKGARARYQKSYR